VPRLNKADRQYFMSEGQNAGTGESFYIYSSAHCLPPRVKLHSPDVEFLLLNAMKNASPRLLLFSATLLPEIKRFVKRFVGETTLIHVNVSQDSLTVAECEQFYVSVKNNKYWNFLRVIQHESPAYSIIFTKTKHTAEQLCKRMQKEKNLGLNVDFLHGDVSQAQREMIVKKFRSKQINCLIGTDVLARGLDFVKVSHVFNYDLPLDPEDYVHRIGRTARMANEGQEIAAGRAISLVTPAQAEEWAKIEKFVKKRISALSIPGIEQFSLDPQESKRRSMPKLEPELKIESKHNLRRNLNHESKRGSKQHAKRKSARFSAN